MLSRVDVISAISAVVLHVGITYGLSILPERPPPPKRTIEVDVVKKTPPPPPPPEIKPPEPVKPPPPPPEVKKVVVKTPKIAPPPEAPPPPPNKTPPPEPPKEPVKPVFGVTMESTTDGDSSFAVPTGNTTMIDPSKSGKRDGKVQPLPAAPPPQTRPSYDPVSPTEIKSEPDIDSTACGRAVQYPSEAEQMGIEGQVLLRIELDEAGKVHAIKVLKGLGHGLDEAAIRAMKYRAECKFKAAIGRDGKGKAFVIERYVFNFELPR